MKRQAAAVEVFPAGEETERLQCDGLDMSTTPSPVDIVTVREGSYYLSPFDKLMAPIVASWARDVRELLWLAPKTPPPLTAAKVVAWITAGGSPFLLRRDGATEPLGYLELNPMADHERHLWMGHCVVDPGHRGCGLGRLMVGLMLDEAFLHRGVDRVSLVVFPENVPAIRCYRRGGFTHAGEQRRSFDATGREYRMLRMTIDRERYDRTRAKPA